MLLSAYMSSMQLESCCLCRPLPSSNALSKSTSLGSAGQVHPAQVQPNILDEGEDVVAEHPMQSPFGSPPPVDLPERHLGPPVQEDHPLDVTAASGSLLSPAARDSSYTFVSHSGSEMGRVSLLPGPSCCYSAYCHVAHSLQHSCTKYHSAPSFWCF